MAINIEGAIRGDDPRIPKVESLNGVTVLGFLNGKVVSVAATLIDLIDITIDHLPYIGGDYYVYVWNKESQVYVKTEVYVKGEQGEKGSKGDTGLKGDKGEKGTKGDTGEKGDIGASIELQVTETYVQWRVVGATTWGNLIALSQLKGEKGDTGDTGAKGDTGDKGDTGPSNTLSIGTVAGGINASASITGIAPNQTLNLVLPKGDKGDTGLKGDTGEKGDKGDVGTPNSLSIGTVTSGQTPSASITGASPSQTLNLTLPKGDTGEKGDKGEKGDAGAGDMLKSVYDPQNKATDVFNYIDGKTTEIGDIAGLSTELTAINSRTVAKVAVDALDIINGVYSGKVLHDFVDEKVGKMSPYKWEYNELTDSLDLVKTI